MRLSQFLENLRNFIVAFYQFILKLIINAHQLIAYWRNRINQNRRSVIVTQTTSLKVVDDNINAVVQVGLNQQTNLNTATGAATSSLSKQQQRPSSEPILPSSQRAASSQLTGLSATKTPNSKRFKLYSILRRLSIRNFMEYCVIALNEASSSGCSNKFDLSSCNGPVWLLGHQYELPGDSDKLVHDIESKLWITYRRNFPPIDENTRYTTDRGFGCMIRCGQMVLANALINKTLGRDWSWNPNGLELNPEVYIKILKLFQDKEDCPYSIHNIVKTGQQEGKNIGEWFGPNTIAQALKRMSSNQLEIEVKNVGQSIFNGEELLISIEAALDNVVVVDEIKSRFKGLRMKQQANNGRQSEEDKINSSSIPDSSSTSTLDPVNTDQITATSCPNQWLPGILFIQLRLGLTKINPLYFSALRKTFQFKNSLGIIGGRPNHALYLVGYTDDDIIYLDPHSTQQYIDFDTEQQRQKQQQFLEGSSLPDDSRSGNNSNSPLDSTYHCACPEKMPIDRLDPSLALCFYFHTELEFDDWCKKSEDLLIKSEQAPMFEITESRPSGWNVQLTSTTIRSTNDDSYSLQQTRTLETTNRPIKMQTCETPNNRPSQIGGKDSEKFTIIKSLDDDNDVEVQDLGVKVGKADKSDDQAAGDRFIMQTNDDEEFEMLG